MRHLVYLLVAIIIVGCSSKTREARHLERANRYFDAGQFDQAEVEYMNVLQITTESPVALGKLGLIYFNQGRFGRAVPFLLKSRQLDSNNLEVRLKLAAIYLAASKFKEAREEASFVLAQRPLDAEAPLVLAGSAFTPQEIDEVRQQLQKLPAPADERAPGHVAAGLLSVRQRDFVGAEAELKRALAIDANYSAAYSALGYLYWEQGDVKKAEQAFQTGAELAPPRSSEKLQYIRFKMQTGDLVAARQGLEAIIQKTPDYLTAWMSLAEIAIREKKYDECAASLRKVLARDPDNYEALFLSGRLQLVSGESGKAVAEFEKMLVLYPQSAHLHQQLALAYLAGKETGKAVNSLNQAVTLNPDFVEAILLLGELKIRTGDPGAAVVALKQLIQKRSNIAQAHLLLAEAYRAQGNLDEALATYQNLLILFPKEFRASFLSGLVLLQQNKKAEARAALEKTLELAPDYLPALELLVDLELMTGQSAAALARVQQQLAKDPQQAGPHYLLGKVYLAQNAVDQAQGSLLKAIELRPDFREAQVLLARLYVSTKKHSQAIANLQQVVAKNPQDTGAFMLMGLIQNEQQNYEAARDAYEKLLTVNPKFGPALNNLADLYSEHLGQLDKAYQLANTARELFPLDPAIGDTLGWILYRKGQYSQALILLKESAAKLPSAPVAQFHLGMAHYAMGEEEAARIALERALQLNKEFPGNEQASQCLALLALDVKTAGVEVLADLKKRVAAKPDDAIALARLAALYARDGALAEAVKTYQAALQVNPKNVRVLISLAQLHDVGLKDTPKAFELAKSAYKLAPDDPAVSYALGKLAYRTGDCKWAMSLLQGTVRNRPGVTEVLFELGQAAYCAGQVATAQAAMQEALQKEPTFPHADDAKRLLEMIALANKPSNSVSSAAQIEQFLQREPNDVPALMVWGLINEQKTDVRAANSTYEKVLSRYPDFAPAKRRLVILNAEDGQDLDKIYTLATQAREVFPEDLELARAVGIIAYRKGDYAAAVNLLKQCATQRHDDARLLYYLGMTHFRRNDRVESKQALGEALALNLAGDSADEAKRVLQQLQ